MNSSRRAFLQTAATGLGAASASRVLSANDRIRLGAIGTGSRGSYLMKILNTLPDIEWVAVCDIYDVRRQEAVQLTGGRTAAYLDYRELLDRKDLDAVLVATPDHWHAQMITDACKAGKDVYVEKPMTSLPEQGRGVLEAAHEHRRIVQVGVQQRSGPHFIEAKEKIVDTGLLGQVTVARTWWNGNRGYLTPVPPGMEQKPAGLDWDRYLGWLPQRPWDPKRYFNRFAYWDISTGGQSGGLFVHLVDVVHWYLGADRPRAAIAGGGIYQYDDGRDTPDTVNFILEYPSRLNVTFEATLSTSTLRDNAGIEFQGSGGVLSIFRGGYNYWPGEPNKGVGELRGDKSPLEINHLKNWLDCIRSRRRPNADEVSGHYSAMACHIGNIAYQTRDRVSWRKEWEV
ncbi:MAG: Gfo/Idh/MocA family oxidoreductase [Acidobacteria bacterium]|nr:Gfo/Idh/MocA family oxidoreductase [Acidobacteriota bacterium]